MNPRDDFYVLQAIIEAAAVPPDTDVPAFIRESWEKLRDSWKNA